MITIQSSRSSNRLQYICHVIFERLLGLTYRIENGPLSSEGIIIQYGNSDNHNQDFLTIPSCGLLFEQGVTSKEISVQRHNDWPYFFEEKTDRPKSYSFDLFSMIFFLITRYEEYGDEKKDKFGRYLSEQSLAVQYNFLELPIVDLWTKDLADRINTLYGTKIKLADNFSIIPTIDIDMPFAFRYKGWRNIFGAIKDLLRMRIANLNSRFIYWKNGIDPYDQFDYLEKLFEDSDFRPIYFVLNRYNRPLDLNHLAQTTHLSELIEKIEKSAEIGIHPSLYSEDSPKKIREEIDLLSSTLNTDVSLSRQHYLRVRFPETYRALNQLGIRHDYSMCYPDRIGFRASTCHPYPWFDLIENKQTALDIHPTQVMDVTLRHYLDLTPQRAMEECSRILNTVTSVHGEFIFIWHNSSLSTFQGWQAWKNIFELMVEEGGQNIAR